VASPTSPTSPQTRNLLAEGLPPRRDSDEEHEDQNWDGEGALFMFVSWTKVLVVFTVPFYMKVTFFSPTVCEGLNIFLSL
jgi:hypothetical protein